MSARVAWTPAQLALFERKGPKGRRPARARPKPAPERSTHIAVADLLRVAARPEVMWWHPANGEYRTAKTGSLLKRMGVKAGVPDFVFVDKQGKHHYLELKRGRLGKLTIAQQLFGSLLLDRGVPYAVAYSFSDAERQLRDWHLLKEE